VTVGKMDKTLRNILILGIIVISASISFYLIRYIPEQKRLEHSIKEKERRLTLQQNCSTDGGKFIDNYNKDYTPNSTSILFAGDPLFTYNDKLNTCLVYAHVFIPASYKFGEKCNMFFDQIFDVYSNRVITEYIQAGLDSKGNCKHGDLSKEEFDKLKLEYFGK
jgi:hypothetical protein